MHKIDLSNYDLRTDLIIEQKTKNNKSNKYVYQNIEVEDIVLEKNNDLEKKEGKYITISFKDILSGTLQSNEKSVFTFSIDNYSFFYICTKNTQPVI